MNKKIRIALISLPIIALGIVGYWQIRKYRVPAKSSLPNNGNAGLPNNLPASQTPAATGCTFPLKKGSNNACVQKLQEALIEAFGPGVLPKYGADGDWGNETQSALINNGLPTQVENADIMVSLIAKIGTDSVSAIPTVNSAAKKIISEIANNKTIKYIVCLDNTAWVQMNLVHFEDWVNAGYVIKVHAGLKMSVADYRILPMPNPDNGFVMVECTKGANAGYWMINPLNIKLE
jgi:hypothetical protein